jgi:hypothetical protein
VTRKLTEAQAWRKLAKRAVTRVGYLCPLLESWGEGLADVWTEAPPPPWGDFRKMLRRIRRHEVGAVVSSDGKLLYGTVFPVDVALGGDCRNSHARVIFCLLMALECEEESRGRASRKH